jgi:hypothetical protein
MNHRFVVQMGKTEDVCMVLVSKSRRNGQQGDGKKEVETNHREVCCEVGRLMELAEDCF